MAEALVLDGKILEYAVGGGWWLVVVENLHWLVVSTPLKNMKVNWDGYFQNMGK